MPSDPESAEEGRRYLKAWSALGSLLQAGRSWSGRERNCAFLNTRGPRFADGSAAFGLDHPSDSRALVATDWDLDGDLDLWFSNRTSPRVRFLRNEGTPGNHFVAIRLEGTRGNRDAIGARVELYTDDGGAPMVRALRAGDGYLSQSSKWLHFGLGMEARDARLRIHWPGGQVEEIANVRPDTRYRITEGRGAAVAWSPPRRSLRLAPSAPSEPAAPSSTRIVPHRRLPLPRLEYVAGSGKTDVVTPPRAGFKLLALWATWCSPCLAELRELADEERSLREAGLEVVALNVDDPESDLSARSRKAGDALEKLSVRIPGGVATARTIEVLDVVQRVLVTIPRGLALPASFLIDSDGRLAAVYRGRVASARLKEELSEAERPRRDPRDAAVPFAGRWFTDPFPPDVLAIPRKLLEISLASEALDYLEAHLAPATAGGRLAPPAGVPAPELAEVYSRAGVELRAQGRLEPAVEALRAAVSCAPGDWDGRTRLAMTLQEQGSLADALAEYERTLEIRRGHLPAENGIAWIRATSPDPALRDPQEAIRRATDVCRRTGFRLPTPLDTLAAAFAAAGRFEEAVKTVRAAIERAASSNETGRVDGMRARLRGYEEGRPYVETSGGE